MLAAPGNRPDASNAENGPLVTPLSVAACGQAEPQGSRLLRILGLPNKVATPLHAEIVPDARMSPSAAVQVACPVSRGRKGREFGRRTEVMGRNASEVARADAFQELAPPSILKAFALLISLKSKDQIKDIGGSPRRVGAASVPNFREALGRPQSILPEFRSRRDRSRARPPPDRSRSSAPCPSPSLALQT